LTASSRETAGAVRSAHVAYFLPPDWARIALHAAPALERGTAGAVRLLAIVPDAGAALALARALGAHPTARHRRVVAATSAARASRLLSLGACDAVIGSPEVLAAALGASKLKLSDVSTVLIAGADEIDTEQDAFAAVLSEVPKDCDRILTALAPSAAVEDLIERYLPKCRRVTEDVAPAPGSAAAPTVRYLTLSGALIDALPMVLDELDAPSATVLCASETDAEAARTLLRNIGYGDSALANVTTDTVAPNTSLVITLGVPSATAWQLAVAATPSQIVSLIAPRDLPALRLLSGATEPRPLTDRASVSRARAAESRRRAELRVELGEGIPSREVLALEPLLREHDGLEIAAAALRLLERVRSRQSELVHEAEQRTRAAMKEAEKEREGEARDARGPRSDGPRSFKPRGDGPREFKPRGDGPREFKPRGDGPREFKPRGDGPRDYKPRGDGPRDYKPRGDGPRGEGRDGPRPFKPRGDGPRDYKPRGDGPRDYKPRGDGPRGEGRDRGGDDKPRISARGPYKPKGRPPRGDR
jgi:hypothetical protein